MKKLTAILLSLLMIGATAFAGNPLEKKGTHEISLSYGQFTVTQLSFTMAGVLGIVLSAGNATFDNFKMPGQVTAGYYYYLGNVVALGADVTNEFMSADQFNADKEYQGKFDADFLHIMPGIKAQWFNNRKFGMYSKANVGVAVLIADEPQATFALQLSPVCCEFGGDKVRGFVEAGFGMEGIVSAGIKYCIH